MTDLCLKALNLQQRLQMCVERMQRTVRSDYTENVSETALNACVQRFCWATPDILGHR